MFEDRIDADLALGRNGVLVGELRELVAQYPLRERLRAQLMAALYRSGRQAEALEVYREGRVALSDELGIEPGPALRELERAILQQDPTLGAPAVPPLRVRSRLRRRWLLLAVAVLSSPEAAAAAILATRGGSGVAAPVTVYPHSVAVIDPANAKVVDDVLVGDYPTTFAADSRYVYVVNNGEATVSRIDPQARRVSDTTALSRAIDLVAVGDHLWAANGGAPGHTPLGVGPGTVLDYGPVPTLQDASASGPSIDGSEEQTTLAARGPDALADLGGKPGQPHRARDRQFARPGPADDPWGRAGGLAVVGSAAGETVWASDPFAERRRPDRREHPPHRPPDPDSRPADETRGRRQRRLGDHERTETACSGASTRGRTRWSPGFPSGSPRSESRSAPARCG